MINPLHKPSALPYSPEDLRIYVQDIERLTVLRNKSKDVNMLDEVKEYDIIISNMQAVLNYMTDANKHHYDQQKDLRK